MTKTKLAIFDFDDTIVHLNVEWPAVEEECNVIIDRDGLTAIDRKQYLAILANEISDTPKRKKEVDAIFERYEAQMAKARDYIILDRMPELVRELHKNRIKLAIASGNTTKTLTTILTQLGLADCFDLVTGRDAVSKNKPDPEPLKIILERLQIEKKDAVMIGDSFVDEQAARAAGVRFININHTNRNEAKRVKKEIPENQEPQRDIRNAYGILKDTDLESVEAEAQKARKGK